LSAAKKGTTSRSAPARYRKGSNKSLDGDYIGPQ
jgi:hypothetical protein